MKILKYGYYVEDDAQKVFLENLLEQIPDYLGLEDKLAFQRDDNFMEEYLVVAETGRNEFDTFFEELCFIGIDEYKQDVFFLGRDLDKPSFDDFECKIVEIKEKLKEICKSKTIIFLPIQCTEHWLRYLKEIKKSENQDLNQKFEDQKKKTIKNNIYGNKKGSEKKQILEELCQHLDIKALSEHTQSFRHFIQSIEQFVGEIIKP